MGCGLKEIFSVAVGNIDFSRPESEPAKRVVRALQGLVGVTVNGSSGALVYFSTPELAKAGLAEMSESGLLEVGDFICRFKVVRGTPVYDCIVN